MVNDTIEQQMLFIENMNHTKLICEYSRYFYPHGISPPKNTPRPGMLVGLAH